MVLHHPSLAAIACACTLAGCAAPKAVVLKAPTPNTHKAATTSIDATPIQKPDDGLRTGDLLVLPRDNEYRTTQPSPPDPNAGTVIVNPPTSPAEGKKTP
jgi:hypothetical protein